MTFNEKNEPFGSRDLETNNRSIPPDSARSSEKERVKVTMPLTAVIACALVVAAVITAIAFAITGIKNAEIKLAAVKPTLTPFIIETESPTTDPWVPDRINPDAFVITIRDHQGNLIQSPPYHHHHTAALSTGVSEYYPNFKEAFEYTGAVTYSQLGNALVYVCDARKMTDTVRLIWERAGGKDLCLEHRPIPEEYYKD